MISLLIAAFATVDMTKFEDAVWFVETSRRAVSYTHLTLPTIRSG